MRLIIPKQIAIRTNYEFHAYHSTGAYRYPPNVSFHVRSGFSARNVFQRRIRTRFVNLTVFKLDSSTLLEAFESVSHFEKEAVSDIFTDTDHLHSNRTRQVRSIPFLAITDRNLCGRFTSGGGEKLFLKA